MDRSIRANRTDHRMTAVRGKATPLMQDEHCHAARFEATSIPLVVQILREGKGRRSCYYDSSIQPVSFACALRLSSCTFSVNQRIQASGAPIKSKQTAFSSTLSYQSH